MSVNIFFILVPLWTAIAMGNTVEETILPWGNLLWARLQKGQNLRLTATNDRDR